jgi:hypothetical protein
LSGVRLSASIHSITLDHHSHITGVAGPAFRFLHLPRSYTFPEKKTFHPMKASDGRPLDGYPIRGIFKSHWITKHVYHVSLARKTFLFLYQDRSCYSCATMSAFLAPLRAIPRGRQIPSVVVLLSSADMQWSVLEWGGRETGIVVEVERLRANLTARDIRLVVVLVRRGRGDEREFDDRVTSLRRRANLEARNVFVLQDPADILPASLALKKLTKYLREHSVAYYLVSFRLLVL